MYVSVAICVHRDSLRQEVQCQLETVSALNQKLASADKKIEDLQTQLQQLKEAAAVGALPFLSLMSFGHQLHANVHMKTLLLL